VSEQGPQRPAYLKLRPHKRSRDPGIRCRPAGASTPSPKERSSTDTAPHPETLEARAARPDASTREGDLVSDPFCGSWTTAVAAKELRRIFVGAELEKESAELAARRIKAVARGRVLREISEQRWSVIPAE
jgi:DNA modification methylase